MAVSQLPGDMLADSGALDFVIDESTRQPSFFLQMLGRWRQASVYRCLAVGGGAQAGLSCQSVVGFDTRGRCVRPL